MYILADVSNESDCANMVNKVIEKYGAKDE